MLAWRPLLEYLEELLAELPPDRDPYLAELPASTKRQVHAGLARYGYTVHRMLGDPVAADRYRSAYERWSADSRLP